VFCLKQTSLGLFEAITNQKLKADTYLSDMALSLGVPVVHVITGETEDLVSTLITAYSGGGASTEITVTAISSFCISFKTLTEQVLMRSV
jgi:hypothetical protein